MKKYYVIDNVTGNQFIVEMDEAELLASEHYWSVLGWKIIEYNEELSNM